VKVEGAALLPEASDALALAAADGFVAFGRRGHATVKLPGAAAGAKVRVKLVRHAFNFGVNIPFFDNRLVPEELVPGSPAERYQKFVLERFNTVVLSNAGKWVYHEEKKDRVTMEHVDRFFEFAEKNGLRARMHTLVWDTVQQPAWVASEDPKKPGLLALALHGDARARAELDRQIAERIGYYVKDRARRYIELDVINESVHKGRYLELYGAAGIADLFKRTARAAKEGGASTRLYLNEYNLFQWSSDPLSGAPDPYANWYRRHAERVLAAGGPVDGLGVQYYPDGREARDIGTNAHSALRAFAVLQNLATTGRRLSLTELTVKSQNATPERAARIVEDTLRLTFGTPEADTFMIWAAWAGAAGDPPVPASVLVDADFDPTEPGKRFDARIATYRTDLELEVQPGGTISFDGFYGDYAVTFGGRTRRLAFTRGQGDYALLD
jgi:GH35 family endo-1,4-beta-xylanase